jgi:hypothetical protein
VAHRFGQTRIDFHFHVEMGVDVEQAGHQPLAGAVDHRARPGRIEIETLGGDAALMDGEVVCLGHLPAAVENQGIFDQQIPCGLASHMHPPPRYRIPRLCHASGSSAGSSAQFPASSNHKPSRRKKKKASVAGLAITFGRTDLRFGPWAHPGLAGKKQGS